MDMMSILAITVALCIVSFLIRIWLRYISFPPNARILCEAWAAVENKMGSDENGNNAKIDKTRTKTRKE